MQLLSAVSEAGSNWKELLELDMGIILAVLELKKLGISLSSASLLSTALSQKHLMISLEISFPRTDRYQAITLFQKMKHLAPPKH